MKINTPKLNYLNQVGKEMPAIIDRAYNMQMLIDLLGHVEAGDDRVVTVFQDDATKQWHCKVNGSDFQGSSLFMALYVAHAAVVQDDKE